jgi:hypothetical protein
MDSGDPYQTGANTAARAAQAVHAVRAAEPVQADDGRQAGPAARRAWAALGWTAGGVALFVLFLLIAETIVMNADGANNALQAWDMLHGHILLHGWIIGDATYYTLELPLIAIIEAFFGLHTVVMFLSAAVVYLGVAVCAVAIAATGSSGASRFARAGVVVAVLAAPTLVGSDVNLPLGVPHHMGTTIFLLVSCLLVDLPTRPRRARGGSGGSSPPEQAFPGRRWTAPLLCLILCAGQIGDETVRYIAVPAIAVVCAYRAVAARRLLTPEAVNLVAVIVSVPLAIVVRAAMRHLGSYLMVSPKTSIAPVSAWRHNAALTWHALMQLFGVQAAPAARPHPVGLAAIFGIACLLAVAFGVLRVLWRWPTARTAEQLLVVAIVINLGVYVISTLPTPRTQFDIIAVLPCGAVLAARALVPARIAGQLTALAVSGVAALAALLPLSVAAAQPAAASSLTPLITWLHARGLNYGLGGYWDGSEVALESGNQVQVRTIEVTRGEVTPYPWETNTAWFDSGKHYANFVIIDLGKDPDLGWNAEPILGKPSSSHRIGDWEVLVYHKNLLRLVRPPHLTRVS